jgi:hypothetical protein
MEYTIMRQDCGNIHRSSIDPLGIPYVNKWKNIYVEYNKMYLTETYSTAGVGKNLSDMFPVKNGSKKGDALSPLLFNFALEYAIRRV